MWNANAALCWLAQTDCAILDVRLPGISGLELQQRLAADGQSIPVIIITAQGDDKTQNEAVVTGAIAFLKKPVKEEVLLSALESALNKY
jgi:FixJ family two-component response regulator